VNPDLAGTLAGLALAAATFLLAVRGDIAERIRRANLDHGNLADDDTSTLDQIDTAVRRLLISFYVFVALLAESLTLDKWVEPHALLGSQHAWALPAEVTLTAITLTTGIGLLGDGARHLLVAAQPNRPSPIEAPAETVAQPQ
jgi:hypothetical protein